MVARVLAVSLVGLLAACSSDSSRSLDDVADRLQELEAASVSLEVTSGGTGFTIDGAFSVDGRHALPVARLTYTPSDDGPATTVVLTGDDGFVEVEGEAYRLPPAELDALRVPKDGATTALSSLRLADWFADVDVNDEGAWSGPGDEEVVLADVVALASGLGASEVVADDVDGVLLVTVLAGEDDDLWSLTATAPGFSFTLELDDHGDPVEVEPPPSARSYEELGR